MTLRTNGLIGDQKLECGHIFHAGNHPVTPGELLFCRKCNASSYIRFSVKLDVDRKPRDLWYWHCQCRNQLRGGYFQKGYVVRVARNHLRVYPGHEIHIVDKFGRIVEVWNTPVPLFTEPLPF